MMQVRVAGCLRCVTRALLHPCVERVFRGSGGRGAVGPGLGAVAAHAAQQVRALRLQHASALKPAVPRPFLSDLVLFIFFVAHLDDFRVQKLRFVAQARLAGTARRAARPLRVDEQQKIVLECRTAANGDDAAMSAPNARASSLDAASRLSCASTQPTAASASAGWAIAERTARQRSARSAAEAPSEVTSTFCGVLARATGAVSVRRRCERRSRGGSPRWRGSAAATVMRRAARARRGAASAGRDA